MVGRARFSVSLFPTLDVNRHVIVYYDYYYLLLPLASRRFGSHNSRLSSLPFRVLVYTCVPSFCGVYSLVFRFSIIFRAVRRVPFRTKRFRFFPLKRPATASPQILSDQKITINVLNERPAGRYSPLIRLESFFTVFPPFLYTAMWYAQPYSSVWFCVSVW